MLHRGVKYQTSLDPQLNALKGMIHTGCPTHITQVPVSLKPYWPFRDELATEGEMIMKAHRIIIPVSLQEKFLMKLHSLHLGTDKTKLRARSSVYWRGLYKDIEETTEACSTCEELYSSQQKEPLISTEVPPRVWHTIGADLFTLHGSEYLVIADYYSKYPFVRKIPRGQSNSYTVVAIMKQIFNEQGIPKVVRSDNGPHFYGQVFQSFAQELDFQHITSSPHYPCSNGFIESQVKSVKSILLKSKLTKTDPDMSLLCLRTTPVVHKLPSTAELLLGSPNSRQPSKKDSTNLASEN